MLTLKPVHFARRLSAWPKSSSRLLALSLFCSCPTERHIDHRGWATLFLQRTICKLNRFHFLTTIPKVWLTNPEYKYEANPRRTRKQTLDGSCISMGTQTMLCTEHTIVVGSAHRRFFTGLATLMVSNFIIPQVLRSSVICLLQYTDL